MLWIAGEGVSPMRRLLLLRHSKTERPEPGQRDRDRRLTARGRADAPLIGTYMVRHRLVPDLVLVSPAQRTVETWALVGAAFSKAPRVVKEDRIYNAGAETLADLVGEADDAMALLLVGHNPGLHDLANALIGSGDVEAREGLHEKLPTSGLVVIDFAFDDWSKLHECAGRLERFVTPHTIGGAAD
jgi:phosphohistidine phosphatase